MGSCKIFVCVSTNWTTQKKMFFAPISLNKYQNCSAPADVPKHNRSCATPTNSSASRIFLESQKDQTGALANNWSFKQHKWQYFWCQIFFTRSKSTLAYKDWYNLCLWTQGLCLELIEELCSELQYPIFTGTQRSPTRKTTSQSCLFAKQSQVSAG